MSHLRLIVYSATGNRVYDRCVPKLVGATVSMQAYSHGTPETYTIEAQGCICTCHEKEGSEQ